MKRILLFSIIVINSSFLLVAQKPTELIRKTRQLSDGTYQLVEKNTNGDTLILGTLSSINPEIRNGEFNFYDSNKIIEAKGYYAGDIPCGIWNYYDKQGNIVKTINYNKTIEFLKADTLKIQEVFLVVEQIPYFKGINSDSIQKFSNLSNPEYFRKYILDNLVYPIYAAKTDISDRVFIQFVITETGRVCNLKVLRSSGNIDLNMEALRIISESPLWKPGKQRNVPVSVSYTFPITFVLN